MLRYIIPALFAPVASYAATSHTGSQLGLDPGLIVGMLILILAQIAVVQLRSKWEKQLVTPSS